MLLTCDQAFLIKGKKDRLIAGCLSSRLFTVPYFFVRSFRYSASYRQWRPSWFSNIPRGRASGIIALSSFDTHARWQPVTQSARSRPSYGKIEVCEQSTSPRNTWHESAIRELKRRQFSATDVNRKWDRSVFTWNTWEGKTTKTNQWGSAGSLVDLD